MSHLSFQPAGGLARNLVIGAVSVLAMVACTSNTSIEQSWTAPSAHSAQLKKVAVVFISPDTVLRHTTEDAMAQQLAKTGTQAVPAYTLLGDQELQDHAAARAKLQAAGFDGVISMRMVSKQQQLEATAPSFDAYWGLAWPAVYSPGYLQTETIVRVESNAYSLASGKLLWSALSKTIDPNNTDELIANVTKVFAHDLEKKGVVV
jgi:hypothetical protein